MPFHSNGNPILVDGSYYSADPAPLVAGDTLYILAGRDEAPADVNDFIMNEWQIFATKDVASGKWIHYPHLTRPEQLFHWAAPGRAYAGQIVEGHDHRFYFYAPVAQATDKFHDPFGVGVAVADSPLGPWKDAHPSGPIASQAMPEASRIQNIDPTVMVDDDGRVYMYWGTFGQLLGVELAQDMITPIGPVVHVSSLKGFFEAAWLFKRGKTYYLSYASNLVGPECTPTLYHACLAYGTSDSPLGPWTYRGVLLGPVSSTTSHEGIIEFNKQWYLIYHTADAKGGGHFRRSVAIDKLEWDDSTTPATIRKVIPTRAPQASRAPSRNIAPAAFASASNEPIATQFWIKALNDERVPADPLPPEMWSTWKPQEIPSKPWVEYAWSKLVTLNGTRLRFWADHDAGAEDGVAPPANLQIKYWNGSAWEPVSETQRDAITTEYFVDVAFTPVTTACLRVEFTASGKSNRNAGVALEEWEALAPTPMPLPAVNTQLGNCPR
ncbi:family 43 glycosylhydrolase [Telmatobacter bradus]|uniref:family 43 glycosylhydrolase n=1 Tax=Telmatobacter bradus TaxID=474953 RepID=UPI003B4352B1